MIIHDFHSHEDLLAYMQRPAFVPVQYRHVKRQTIYTVVSDSEVHLNTFSEEGSLHQFPLNGRMVVCEMQFSGGTADESGRICRYAGPITIYQGQDGKYWLRPSYEFHERFEKVD